MNEDIRNKIHVDHKDIIELNFIRNPGKYFFRQYYKQGLRSHIMEVLDPDDIRRQEEGAFIGGVKQFPWAEPLKMLRIFRSVFSSPEAVFEEIKKYKIVEDYLPKDSYARSYEFMVDYLSEGCWNVMLCGLQEYVEGEVLNPWGLTQDAYLAILLKGRYKGHFNGSVNDSAEGSAGGPPVGGETLVKLPYEGDAGRLVRRSKQKAARFMEGLKKMILEANYVPDLAGVGNLILTAGGDITLVDINNISGVSFEPSIRLDDKGYPICDKSIEAMSLLEQHVLEKAIDKTEPIYRIFLAPQRMSRVKELEEEFYRSLMSGKTPIYPQYNREKLLNVPNSGRKIP
jgi:hypothetical protein